MKAIGWRLAWNLARRDLHRSLQGLRLLFLCIFLGVATLAAIGSLTSAITTEIAERGRVILGGDLQISMSQRQASPSELQAMRSRGEICIAAFRACGCCSSASSSASRRWPRSAA